MEKKCKCCYLDIQLKANGMTHKDLGDIFRVSDRTVRRWANGERVPRLDIALKIAYVLGCNVEDIWFF